MGNRGVFKPGHIPEPPKNQKTCKICGEYFVPKFPAQLICSGECKKIAKEQEKERKKIKWRKEHSGHHAPTVTVKCQECGADIVMYEFRYKQGWIAPVCSLECAGEWFVSHKDNKPEDELNRKKVINYITNRGYTIRELLDELGIEYTFEHKFFGGSKIIVTGW